MEAYSEVYAPQEELTEEQVWEEVENWVNSLVEEGYDLSEYTWEEMYVAYIEEQGGRGSSTASQTNQSVNIPNPFPAISNFFKGSGGAGTTGGRQTNTRGGGQLRSTTVPSRPQPTFQNTGGYGRYGAPGTQVRTPTPAAPARPAPAPRAAAPAARPAAAPARPTTPAAGTQKPAPASTPAASSPRQKDTSITDMIGRSQVRQGAAVNTGSTSSDARAIAARSSVGASPSSTAAKPTPSAPSLQQSVRNRRLNMDFDPFDVIKGHLLDEGYADTEESALAIMTNMSETWKEEILEGVLGEDKKYDRNRQRAAQRAAARNRARQEGKTGNVSGVGYVSPRPERETYTDSAGVERHTSGARMPKKDS
jgi:hypothetical protein